MKPADGLTYEELNGEIVVLDAQAQMVHRISGETAEAVRRQRDEMTRRRMIQAAVALGIAAGVSSIALPSAAAAASGASEPALGSSYFGYAGDPGVTAPASVGATAGNQQVTVTWNSVAGATGYRVYKSTDGGMNYTLAWSGLATSTTIGSLSNGTTYTFMVVTVKSGLVSAQSASASATPVDAPPAVPTGLSAMFRRGAGWTLYWSNGTGGATPTGYYVLYQTNYTDAQNDIYVGPVDAQNTTSLQVATSSGYIKFKVAAYTATQTSAYSAAVEAGV